MVSPNDLLLARARGQLHRLRASTAELERALGPPPVPGSDIQESSSTTLSRTLLSELRELFIIFEGDVSSIHDTDGASALNDEANALNILRNGSEENEYCSRRLDANAIMSNPVLFDLYQKCNEGKPNDISTLVWLLHTKKLEGSPKCWALITKHGTIDPFAFNKAYFHLLDLWEDGSPPGDIGDVDFGLPANSPPYLQKQVKASYKAARAILYDDTKGNKLRRGWKFAFKFDGHSLIYITFATLEGKKLSDGVIYNQLKVFERPAEQLPAIDEETSLSFPPLTDEEDDESGPARSHNANNSSLDEGDTVDGSRDDAPSLPQSPGMTLPFTIIDDRADDVSMLSSGVREVPRDLEAAQLHPRDEDENQGEDEMKLLVEMTENSIDKVVGALVHDMPNVSQNVAECIVHLLYDQNGNRVELDDELEETFRRESLSEIRRKFANLEEGDTQIIKALAKRVCDFLIHYFSHYRCV